MEAEADPFAAMQKTMIVEQDVVKISNPM